MNKRKYIALSLLIALLSSGINKDSTNTSLKNKIERKIYIGDDDYLDSLKDVKQGDILILDRRNDDDPNVRIINSYLITDYPTINKVINMLKEYEKENPTEWNRTSRSMKIEWIIHNYSYYFNYKKGSSRDVDLNNADEEKYSKILKIK